MDVSKTVKRFNSYCQIEPKSKICYGLCECVPVCVCDVYLGLIMSIDNEIALTAVNGNRCGLKAIPNQYRKLLWDFRQLLPTKWTNFDLKTIRNCL